MAGRLIKTPPKLSALVCALFDDNGRYLFLSRLDERGRALIELPGVLVDEGEDPVATLKAHLQHALGLDTQIHLIALRGLYNAGSRKRRHLIPVLAFKCSAKKMTVRLPSPFTSSRWLTAEDALKEKMGRNTEWLSRAEKV